MHKMQKIIVHEVRFNPHEVSLKNWKTGISKFHEILIFLMFSLI